MPIVIILLLFSIIASIFAWSRIYYRMGWSPWMGFLMAIPVANIAMVIGIAFVRWPIEERMAAMEHDLKELRGEL